VVHRMRSWVMLGVLIAFAGLWVAVLCLNGHGVYAVDDAAKAAPAPAPAPTAAGRVVILGFDGVEPTIVDAMLAAGQLPNLAKLRDQGGYQRLASSNPPQSPTAWSSFATGKLPGNHGVYDFVRRTPESYKPGLGFGTLKQPELAPDGALAKPASF